MSYAQGDFKGKQLSLVPKEETEAHDHIGRWQALEYNTRAAPSTSSSWKPSPNTALAPGISKTAGSPSNHGLRLLSPWSCKQNTKTSRKSRIWYHTNTAQPIMSQTPLSVWWGQPASPGPQSPPHPSPLLSAWPDSQLLPRPLHTDKLPCGLTLPADVTQ